jgi:hypothetical protein
VAHQRGQELTRSGRVLPRLTLTQFEHLQCGAAQRVAEGGEVRACRKQRVAEVVDEQSLQATSLQQPGKARQRCRREVAVFEEDVAHAGFSNAAHQGTSHGDVLQSGMANSKLFDLPAVEGQSRSQV